MVCADDEALDIPFCGCHGGVLSDIGVVCADDEALDIPFCGCRRGVLSDIGVVWRSFRYSVSWLSQGCSV